MRAYTYQPAVDAYALHLADRPTPDPGPGQVRVSVNAVSLNYRDLIALRNKAGRKVAGVVPCSDGAGVISAVGPDVTAWQVGDRVAGCFFQTWEVGRFDMLHHKHDLGGTLDGMLAEEVVLTRRRGGANPGRLLVRRGGVPAVCRRHGLAGAVRPRPAATQ